MSFSRSSVSDPPTFTGGIPLYKSPPTSLYVTPSQRAILDPPYYLIHINPYGYFGCTCQCGGRGRGVCLLKPSWMAEVEVGGWREGDVRGKKIKRPCSITPQLNSRSHCYNQRIEVMVKSPLRIIYLLLAVISGRKMVEALF